ncbi:hypothetical protein HYZ70_00495 [Candidatus Curtissbacteria bacterium]|nr:hypothetical protein [Candidatus Curtissbacteria bacterium]
MTKGAERVEEASAEALGDTWREAKISVARFLEKYGLTIRDAEAVTTFFCNPRWNVEARGTIQGEQGVPQVIFTERDFKGFMGRRVTFAFLGTEGEKRLLAKVDWIGRESGFDFREYMWRSCAGSPEVSSVSSVRLIRRALVISGARFVSFSSGEDGPSLAMADFAAKGRVGRNLQTIRIGQAGGVYTGVNHRPYVLRG